MLQRLLELRWPLNAVLTNDTLTSRDHRHLCFSNDNWDRAKDLVATLADLEEATGDLSGDSYVTISWVYPLMRKLRKRMKAGEKDRPAIRAIKKKLCDQLTTRFGLDAPVPPSVPVIAAALDPR